MQKIAGRTQYKLRPCRVLNIYNLFLITYKFFLVSIHYTFRKKYIKDYSFYKKVVYLHNNQLIKYNEQSVAKLQNYF
jgi:hypothetical protein